MALTDDEKLVICTAVLRGEPVERGNVVLTKHMDGSFCLCSVDGTAPVLCTRSWDEALFNFEERLDNAVRQPPVMPKMREYTVRIIMSELTIIAESAERAEEIAMEIYEGDARTHLDHSLFVEACEVDDRGPSDEDEETEV